MYFLGDWSMAGSPPHKRGKVDVLFGGLVDGRITPAQAGKSYRVYHCLASCWNHPRKAGKRNWTIGSRLLNWDHPRVGGEKAAASTAASSRPGSPPRGRGKGMAATVALKARRITPAWAGKSSTRELLLIVSRDHPPHGRGIVVHKLNGRIIPGITPAWVGKRPSHCSERRRLQDHPRVGGEKLRMGFLRGLVLGSPPRGRGKGRRVVDHHPLPGITPAWAGKRLL